MQAGGPRVILFQWPIVGLFSTLVAMAMAEVNSAYPTAGGMYYWSAKLAKRNQAGWSWFTGWVNIIGLIGVVASVDYALAVFTSFFLDYYIDSIFGYSLADASALYIIFAVILVLHGLLNTFGVRLLKWLGDISVWWHVIGAALIVIAMLVIPSNTEGFGSLLDGKNLTGWGFTGAYWFYVFPIGLLLSQYMLTGYDASAHVAEETKDAAVNASKAMVRSVWISALAAWVITVVMIAAVPVGAYDDIALVGINSAPTLFEQAVGGNMAKLLVFTAVLGQFFCGMFGMTSLSRTVYAMARDRWDTRQRALEPHQPEDAHAHQRRLVRRHRVRIARAAVARPIRQLLVCLLRVRGDHRHRALHGLCDAGVPAASQPRLPPRAVEPRPLERARGLDGDRLGGDHRHPVRAAGVRAGGRVLAAVGGQQPEPVQLCRSGVPCGPGADRALVAGLGPPLVHRTPGAGLRGGAPEDREGAGRARAGRGDSRAPAGARPRSGR